MNYKVLMTIMGLRIGGAETHVLELCKALSKKGLTVYVASNGGEYEKELSEAGIKHFKVPLHNKKLKNIIASLFALKKIIIENDIRLVHAHARIPAFICGILQKFLKFRFVTTAHLDFHISFLYKMLTNWGEASLAVSDDIKQYLVDNYGVDPAKVFVTINGIDTEKFSAGVDFGGVMDEFSLDPGKRRIVFISRLDKDRSLPAHVLLQCAESIADKDVEIIIVGGGNDFDEVKKKADAVNGKLGYRLVTLTGGRTDINRFTACADIFVGPSRSALEAMSAGKPVIVAHNQGYIGIFDETKLAVGISTNFCCRGCEMTSIELMERDLLALLDMDYEKLAALGSYGREVVKSLYSVERMADDALLLYEAVRKPKKKHDVIISGYYGSKNHGDDVLLKAIIDGLRERKGDIDITVLSRRPKETAKTYGVRAISRLNIPRILLMQGRANLMLLGAGSLIQDITSTQSLVYYLFIINSALRRGAKVMLYANGIGPLRSEHNRRQAAKTLNRVDLITLREASSLKILKEMNVTKPPVYVTADPAFCVDNATEGKQRGEFVEKLLLNAGVRGRFFCVAVRSWRTLKSDFEDSVAEFCRGVTAKYGYSPLFIAMQPKKDGEITRRIMSKAGGYFLGNDFSLSEILGVVEKSEFVVGMRLHTMIYAAKSAAPIIGLVYDPKVKALMEQFSQPYYMNVEDTNAETLARFADDVIKNREAISRAIAEKSAELERLADKNADMAYEIINMNIF